MCDIASVDIGGTGLFDYAKVDEAISRIVDATHPRMIVVFGSVSRHEAEDGSDLDLLLVFDDVESERDLYATIARQFVGLGLPFDLVVMSYADFLRYKDNEYSFTHEIVTTGRVVYHIGNRDGIMPVGSEERIIEGLYRAYLRRDSFREVRLSTHTPGHPSYQHILVRGFKTLYDIFPSWSPRRSSSVRSSQ